MIPNSAHLAEHATALRSEEQARIERTLPPGKTYAEAVERASKKAAYLWSAYEWMLMPEDERVEELQRFCIALCGGNRKAGEALASTAIWNRCAVLEVEE